MSTIRNLSFLAFFLAVVWAAPLRASTSALECVVDYYDCGREDFCIETTCNFTPYACPEAYPFFCSDEGMNCSDYCGWGAANLYCDGDNFTCWSVCWCD